MATQPERNESDAGKERDDEEKKKKWKGMRPEKPEMTERDEAEPGTPGTGEDIDPRTGERFNEGIGGA